MSKRRNFILLAAPLVLIGCFFLPNAVSGVTDANKLDNLVMMESQGVSFESGSILNIPERLALAANANTESLRLKNGRFFSSDSASAHTVSELIRFLAGSPFEFDFDSYIVDECTAGFTIDLDDPSVNFIIWSVTLTDASGRKINASLDDETGTILNMVYRKTTVSLHANNAEIEPELRIPDLKSDVLYAAAELITQMLSDYYGLKVSLEDYMSGGELAYYRADLSAGETILPMYGVVRESGFSINERVSNSQ